MMFPTPPTPPMSESNVRGVVSNVSKLSDLAAKISVRLFALSRKIKDASKPMEALSKDVASVGAVLNQLGQQLKKGEDVRGRSSTLVTSVDDLVEECSNIFGSIDKALDDDNTGCRPILGLQHYVHFTSLQPDLVLLETNLERLKTPLALMLNVLMYAEQLDSQEKNQQLKDQQELIKVLNEERKRNERRFHKLVTENKAALEEASAIEALKKEPRSSQEAPNQEGKNAGPRARGRVWITNDSPDQGGEVPEKDSSAMPCSSATKEKADRDQGRVHLPDGSGDADDDDDSSLLDMESFLRSTDPDSRRRPGEDTSTRPVKHYRFRSREEVHGPIIKGETFDLLKFFREASPRVMRRGHARRPPCTMPTRHAADPSTPPTTGHGDTQKTWPLPPNVSPVKTRLRSRSLGLASPLASHPPLPETDSTRLASAKWPLQAVIAWLEKNYFSAEWQETFRVLQIEGPGFVELESGQSIRKMLTVIYPQLAKECSRSGKGWDQEQERAEGQRLRKLIRELPVDMKYQDGPLISRPETVSDGPPTIPSPPPKENALPVGLGDVSSLAEDTTPRVRQTQALKQPQRTAVLPIRKYEEEQPSNAAAAPRVRKLSDQRYGKGESELRPTVHDEWVRKWTVLSPEQIARGKPLASTTWLVD